MALWSITLPLRGALWSRMPPTGGGLLHPSTDTIPSFHPLDFSNWPNKFLHMLAIQVHIQYKEWDDRVLCQFHTSNTNPVKNLSSQLTHCKLTWKLTARSFWSHSSTSKCTQEMISQLWPSRESSMSLHLTPWACCDLFVRSTDELSLQRSSVLTMI